jgi:hypothetical protein
MASKAKASERNWNNGLRMDTAVASPVLRRKVFRFSPGPRTTPFTASATVKHNFGAIGYAGIVKAVYLSIGVLPNIATSATARLVAYDTSANAEINLTDTFDVEDSTTTLVAREAAAMTLAGTNVALAADDTFEVHLVAGGAVTANATDVSVVVVFEATEDTVIDD